MRLFKKRSSGLKPIHHNATVVPHLPQLPPPARATPTASTRAHASEPIVARPGAIEKPQQYVLRLSDGQHVPVGAHCLVGRLEPTGLEGIDSFATVDDSSGLVSRRHFEFGQTQDDSCWVMDADSANGTYLVTNGNTQRLAPLAKRPLTPTDEIRFGSMTAQLLQLPDGQVPASSAARRARRARSAENT